MTSGFRSSNHMYFNRIISTLYLCTVSLKYMLMSKSDLKVTYPVLSKSTYHNQNTDVIRTLKIRWYITRTTDAQRGNSLHCTAENSIPITNI